MVAASKHFSTYELDRWIDPAGETILRYGFNTIVEMQDLVEYYLPPFQQCARDSKVKPSMCSYNALNGTPRVRQHVPHADRVAELLGVGGREPVYHQ